MRAKFIFLVFLSMIFATVIKAQNIIQDTFMNMTLGGEISQQSISDNVGGRGYFVTIKDLVQHKEVTYKNLVFGGNTWDYAVFDFTTDEIFSSFIVYDYYSSQKDALVFYDSLRNKIKNKYRISSKNESDNKNKWMRFDGDNGITLILYCNYSKSTSGTYYYYVGMRYYHIDTIDAIWSAQYDEF